MEYRYRIYSPGKYIGNGSDFVVDDQTRSTGFTSLYAVDLHASKALLAEGTAKGFKGVVWNERLWIDVDSYRAAEATESILIEKGLDYVAFDSGGRGAHFGVLRHHNPSHLLPVKDKAWAKSKIPDADLSIYTHMHLFRLPGTMHEETGRIKELVSSRRGAALILPPLAEESIGYALEGINKDYSSKSIFDQFRVMMNTVPASAGDRHFTLVRLTYALKDDAKVGEREALWWLSETNKMFSEPKSIEALEEIIKSIYR